MRTLLRLCLALFSFIGSCKADAVCSVPDTKKAYVTTLSLNMARSVGPCIPPDPSVLIALNLGEVKDPTAQEMLVKQLKDDAAEKISKNQPFSSGKVALYVLALRSSCADPNHISISGGNINLVDTLEQKTQKELENCGSSQCSSPLTTWYQVSLDVLALCVMSRPSVFTPAGTLARCIGPTAGGSVDTAAVAVMALTCVLDMKDIPAETRSTVRGSLSHLLDNLLLSQKSDGLIGNAYSTGLAGQALTAAQTYYILEKWDCSKTLKKVLDLIPLRTFYLPISSAQLLPFLRGVSYISVKDRQCPQDSASMISVDYTVVNDLIGEHFKHSIVVQVREGSTVLQVMEEAAKLNPKEFSFSTQKSSWGVFITGINNLEGSTNDKTYWQLFESNTPLDKGAGEFVAKNGDHIVAVFSKY